MEKDFWEVHDSLPQDQRQQLIDHMALTLLGKPVKPLIFTKSLTISNDASLEERIGLAAQAYGVDPKAIDQEEFLRSEREMAESKIEIWKLIGKHYGQDNQRANGNKDDEILSLGKFLYTTQLPGTITPGEEPDFIVHKEDHIIGLEHTRLEAEKDKGYVSELWKKYLNDPFSQITNKNPGLTGLVNITLDADAKIIGNKTLRDFKSKEIKLNIRTIHKELEDCICAEISGDIGTLPTCVKSIKYQQSLEPFALKINQEYFARIDFEDMLHSSIEKKEKRLVAYKQKSNLNEWWLLITYSEAGASSAFKIPEGGLSAGIGSRYDRIFILNTFNLACHELIPEHPYMKYIAKKQFSTLRIKKDDDK